MLATNYYAPGCHKLQTKSEIFQPQYTASKKRCFNFPLCLYKVQRHRGQRVQDQRSKRDRHVAESTQIDFQPSYYVMLQSPGIYHHFLAAQCSESCGSIMEDVLRCKPMEIQTASNQTPVSVSRALTAINVTIYFVLKRFSG